MKRIRNINPKESVKNENQFWLSFELKKRIRRRIIQTEGITHPEVVSKNPDRIKQFWHVSKDSNKSFDMGVCGNFYIVFWVFRTSITIG